VILPEKSLPNRVKILSSKNIADKN